MKLKLTIFFIIFGFTSIRGEAESESNSIENDTDSSELEISNRIFGGTSANVNLYPYVARLSISYSTGLSQVCSGVVVTSKIILTVAHCVKRPGGEKATLVRATLPQGGWYTFSKNEILIHPHYHSLHGADIAVLRKDTTSTFMRNFEPVPCLPSQTVKLEVPESPAVIAGWGRTEDSPLFTSRLQVASVNIMRSEACNSLTAEIRGTMNPNAIICTSNNDAGLCAGDWGGPLLVLKDGNTVLQGLNMFRGGDCSNEFDVPSAYFNLEAVGDWLKRLDPELKLSFC